MQHLANPGLHGDLMIADLEEINRVRGGVGQPAIRAGMMGVPGFHDRFLMVDDTVWHFGDSFRSLGESVSMASRVRNLQSLLPILLDARARAIQFAEYWARARPEDPAP